MTMPLSGASPLGVFVGLATCDIVQRVARPPGPDEKVTASWQSVFAGGPAANAAVTFAALGGRAVLLTRVGTGPVADVVRADLATCGVEIIDVADASFSLAVSAVVVEEGAGRRQVVSTDGGSPTPARALPGDAARALAAADVLLFDGHHPDLARLALAHRSPAVGPVVLDAGRWKPAMGDLLPACTHVLCSAAFRLGNETGHVDADAATGEALLSEIVRRGADVAAVTAGAGPIAWRTRSAHGEVTPPTVAAVDTLGAGDVLHGAYAHALAMAAGEPEPGAPARALASASEAAALSCTVLGTRAWRDLLPARAEADERR